MATVDSEACMIFSAPGLRYRLWVCVWGMWGVWGVWWVWIDVQTLGGYGGWWMVDGGWWMVDGGGWLAVALNCVEESVIVSHGIRLITYSSNHTKKGSLTYL